MAQKKSTRGGTNESPARGESLSAEERAAIKERAAELKTQSRRAKGAEKAAADEADASCAVAR